MPPTSPGPATLRRLTEIRPEKGRVLSLFLDLDPAEFATPDARATAVTSLLDEARQAVEGAAPGLDHEAHEALKVDLDRAREHLEDDLPGDGAQGVALFLCSPEGLDALLPLPGPVPSQAIVDEAPAVQPLLTVAPAVRWCVLLVNRRAARILEGTRQGLSEVRAFESDVHGSHQAGGWSQARFERSVEEDVRDHLRDVGETLRRRYARGRRWDALLIGCPGEQRGAIEDALPEAVAGALRGWIDVDVGDASPDEVLEAAAEAMHEQEVRHERERLDVLHEALGQGGRGASGATDVLDALNQQKVETLLLEEGAEVAGARCPECGLLYEPGVTACPLDGAETEERDDLLQPMAEAALAQDAEALVIREHPDLGPHGGVAAILRY